MVLSTQFFQQDGITVPYPPFADGTRNNFGFVDLRGRPDAAETIVETTSSLALKNFLINLSQHNSPYFSVGCDLGAREEIEDQQTKYIAGGYIQILFSKYADKSSDNYFCLSQHVAQFIEKKSENKSWRLELVLTGIMLRLDNFNEITPALGIWFHASAESPEVSVLSRESMISELCAALNDYDHTSATP